MDKNNIIYSKSSRVIRVLLSIVLFILTSVTVVILFSTFMNSFKTKSDLISNTFGFPRHFTLDNYIKVLTRENFGRYFLNSIVLTIGGIILLILVSSMVAYGLSRYRFRGQKSLQTYFMLGLMFPMQLCILPLFTILRSIGLVNNLLGMMLIYAAGMSFPVFVFSNFFRSISVSLEESARLDGANDFIVYFRIILPICKPVIFTVALINSVTIWNDFYMPLIFLSKPAVRTITLGVYSYMSNFLRYWDLAFSAVVITLIPVLIIYFVFSNQVVAGMTGGALKE